MWLQAFSWTFFSCSCQGINLTNCRYDSGRSQKEKKKNQIKQTPQIHDRNSKRFCVSVRRAAEKLGIKEAKAGEDWTLFWSDARPCEDKFKEMKPYQVMSLQW